MKQLFFSSLLCLLLAPLLANAQSSSVEPGYLRFPEVPPFAITLPSGKEFNNSEIKKHKPVMIILFSVDCEHCQHETKEITKNIKKFKGTQIVMITNFKHDEMTAFYKGYGIQHYSDIIIMGTDSTFRLNFFYQLRFWPGIYIYNKHNKLVYHNQGTTHIDTLVHYLKDENNLRE
jgi:cytochrome oxidase Cu insertion factor (SCO1/SenC/PrrC family)